MVDKNRVRVGQDDEPIDEFNYPTETDKYRPVHLAAKVRKATKVKASHDADHKRLIKLAVHAVVIAAIACSLLLEGGKMADWLFVGLSVLVEVN